MARNRVQYQKGLSEAEFDRQYGSEEQCRAAVAKWRWPDGFVCPRCGGCQRRLNFPENCRTKNPWLAGCR